jgi:hypothetical protein
VISARMRYLLDSCVKLMAAGDENRQLDFFPLRSELRQSGADCIAYLAEQTERTTNGRLSVRETRHDAVMNAPMGISDLFLAVCSASTPKGVVTSPAENMTAYIIAPGRGLGCTRAEWTTVGP